MRFSDWGVDTGLGMLLSEAQEAPAWLRPVFLIATGGGGVGICLLTASGLFSACLPKVRR